MTIKVEHMILTNHSIIIWEIMSKSC